MKNTYLLFNAHDGLVKIGISKNVKSRIYSLKGFVDITPQDGLHHSIEAAFKHFYKAYSVEHGGIKNEVFSITPKEAIQFILKAQAAIESEPEHAPRWMLKYASARRAGLKNTHTDLWFMKSHGGDSCHLHPSLSLSSLQTRKAA